MTQSVKSLLILFVPFVSFSALSQDFEKIRLELTDIYEGSFVLRSTAESTIVRFGADSPELDSVSLAIERFDKESLSKVTDIIDQYGWISKSKIGSVANQALFVAIQNASDNKVREKYFPMLKASAKKGGSRKVDMAAMQDLILVQNGKNQIYATQSKMVDGKLEYYPIENIKRLNKRRKKVGLKKIKITK